MSPTPQLQIFISKDFCLQPGLEWKFLPRRTWSGQELPPLQFPGLSLPYQGKPGFLSKDSLLPPRIRWTIGRRWGQIRILKIGLHWRRIGFGWCKKSWETFALLGSKKDHSHFAPSPNQFQAPPSYGSGRYGFGVSRAQDSILRDRGSVGTRHVFFSITFISI